MPSPHEASVEWERLFWTVFESSRNPIALLDEHRVFVAVNPEVSKLFGASKEALVGISADRFIAPEERRSRLDADWAQLWRTGDWHDVRAGALPDGSRVRWELAMRTAEIAGRQIAVVVVLKAEREEEPAPSVQLGSLTPREREVVSLVALGLTSGEIAERLVVSPATVRTHVQNAMAKMGARTRAHLVAIALADRLIVAVGRPSRR